MILEELFFWVIGASALYIVIRVGFSFFKKKANAPRQRSSTHLREVQERKRVAAEELEAARLEAEALALEKEAERVALEAFDTRLEGKSDGGSTPHRQ